MLMGVIMRLFGRVATVFALITTVVVSVVAGVGVLPVSSAGAVGEGSFRPVIPARILDTREGIGAPVGKIGPKETLTLQVAGQGGVPNIGATAVSVNITVTQPSTSSYLTVWPTGFSRPTVSLLNFVANATIANSTVVGLSPDGTLSIYNASGSTHVIVDVSGWFPVGGDFVTVIPTRLLDTRTGTGAPAVKVGPGQTVVLQVTGQGGVPASGASAVSVNITATQPSTTSFLTVWQTYNARPAASILNFPAATTIANSTIVGLARDGTISLFNKSGSTHLLVDVSGWFRDTGGFNAITPARLLDTRTGNGAPAVKVGPGETVELQVTGRGVIPAAGVLAVSVNITATEPSASSWLTVWPTGFPRPDVSILNYPAGRTIANSTLVFLSPDGKMSLFNRSGSTHLLVDVSGWSPSGAGGL